MKRRVLIVEDDTSVANLIRFVFKDEFDLELLIAGDEHSAKAILESECVDAVITDIQLNSHKGGLDVLKFARDRDLPVAVMTAGAVESDSFYLGEGAALVLHKPFDVLQLPHIAKELLTSHG